MKIILIKSKAFWILEEEGERRLIKVWKILLIYYCIFWTRGGGHDVMIKDHLGRPFRKTFSFYNIHKLTYLKLFVCIEKCNIFIKLYSQHFILKEFNICKQKLNMMLILFYKACFIFHNFENMILSEKSGQTPGLSIFT